jgi:iron complex transport system ATP-binding protein
VTLAANAVSVAVPGREILRDVSLEVGAGEVVALIGPNGAGKSTLLRVLAGDLAPDRGSVTLSGAPLGSMRAADLARSRAVLSQELEVAFDFTLLELVLLGRAPHDALETPRGRSAARAALERVELGDRADSPLTTLSGGERQRVHLARVFCQLGYADPDLEARPDRFLLLDEPVSQQDPAHQLAVMDHVRALASRGAGVLVVLHDLDLAAAACDRLVLLAEGRVAASGAPREVLEPGLLAEVFGVEAHVDAAPWDDGPPRVTFRRSSATPRA